MGQAERPQEERHLRIPSSRPSSLQEKKTHISVAQASPSVALRYSNQRKLRDHPQPTRRPRPAFSPAGVSSHASSCFWPSDALLTHHPSPQHTHTHTRPKPFFCSYIWVIWPSFSVPQSRPQHTCGLIHFLDCMTLLLFPSCRQQPGLLPYPPVK